MNADKSTPLKHGRKLVVHISKCLQHLNDFALTLISAYQSISVISGKILMFLCAPRVLCGTTSKILG
jgi:hypothetical protein